MIDDWSLVDEWLLFVAAFERQVWIERNWYKRLEQYWI